MKNLMLIVILAAAGYYAYRYVSLNSQESAPEQTSSQSGLNLYVPPVPEDCQGKAREYENAVYSADSPRTSFAQRNYAKRAFMTCLKDAGFSDEQMSAVLSEREDRAQGWAEQDGGVTW